MPRRNTHLSLGVLAAVFACTGCEEIEATPDDLAATPEPAETTQTPQTPSSTRVTEGQSAYGKAYKRAERLEDEINAYQDEVIKTADSVFDDS
ncbi:MAG: hypothetical protein RLZZ461_481 [Planctomycetota bacterium]|jgi:sugar (pentulose or hexulose) kinase